jgi:hypothetical protein
MSTFEELRELAKQWNTANDDYNAKALSFARQFAIEFSRHIGAPEQCFDQVAMKPCVAVTRRQEAHGGSISYPEIASIGETLDWDDNGYWIFGLLLRIDPASNASSKRTFTITSSNTTFTFPLRFFLREDTCELKIDPDGVFEVATTRPESWTPAHEYMTDLLKKLFLSKPWELYEQKRAIGFLTGRA